MKRILSLGAGLVALTVAPALAADIPVKAPVLAPVVAPPMTWTGFYIGGHAGYAWGRADISHSAIVAAPGLAFPIDAAALTAAGSPSLRPDNFTGGVHIGYNYQIGSFVWGLETDFSYFRLSSTTTGVFAFPSTLPGGPLGPPTLTFPSTTSFETNWLWTLRPRLGFAADNWLLYVTGGLALTEQKVNQVTGALAAATFPASISDTRVGWAVGAGVEYAFTRNWSVRAEYMHLDFGTATGPGTAVLPAGVLGNALCTPASPVLVGPAVLGGCSISSRFTADLGRVGLTYRF